MTTNAELMATPHNEKDRAIAPTLPSLPMARRPGEPMVRLPEPGRSETVVLTGKPKKKPKSIDRR